MRFQTFTAERPWSDRQATPVDDIRRAVQTAKAEGHHPDALYIPQFVLDRMTTNDQAKHVHPALLAPETSEFMGLTLVREPHPDWRQDEAVITTTDGYGYGIRNLLPPERTLVNTAPVQKVVTVKPVTPPKVLPWRSQMRAPEAPPSTVAVATAPRVIQEPRPGSLPLRGAYLADRAQSLMATAAHVTDQPEDDPAEGVPESPRRGRRPPL